MQIGEKELKKFNARILIKLADCKEVDYSVLVRELERSVKGFHLELSDEAKAEELVNIATCCVILTEKLGKLK